MSPGSTPPLGGIASELCVECEHEAEDTSAVSINLFAFPRNLPSGARCSFRFLVSTRPAMERRYTSPPLAAGEQSVFDDFFGVGPMEGGWDEAAWASKGLPTAGCLAVKLSVVKVGHMTNVAS